MISVADMKVKPVDPSAVIRFPNDLRRLLRPEGEEVPDDNYWLRRVRDGSVVRIDEPTGREPITPLSTR